MYLQMQRFYDLHTKELGPGKRAYQQQLERARANKKWMDNYETTVTDWLKNYNKLRKAAQ